MNAEINNAYETAKQLLSKLRVANGKFVKALERKGEADISLDSVTALVTREIENTSTSKAAQERLVKGDQRVLDAKAEQIRASVEVKHQDALVSFIEKQHDLEKKRMSAEIEESKRIDIRS